MKKKNVLLLLVFIVALVCIGSIEKHCETPNGYGVSVR